MAPSVEGGALRMDRMEDGRLLLLQQNHPTPYKIQIYKSLCIFVELPKCERNSLKIVFLYKFVQIQRKKNCLKKLKLMSNNAKDSKTIDSD